MRGIGTLKRRNHAQRINEEIFNANDDLNRVAQDLQSIAHAMDVLGMDTSSVLHAIAATVRRSGQTVVSAHTEYVRRQADNTLYEEDTGDQERP